MNDYYVLYQVLLLYYMREEGKLHAVHDEPLDTGDRRDRRGLVQVLV